MYQLLGGLGDALCFFRPRIIWSTSFGDRKLRLGLGLSLLPRASEPEPLNHKPLKNQPLPLSRAEGVLPWVFGFSHPGNSGIINATCVMNINEDEVVVSINREPWHSPQYLRIFIIGNPKHVLRLYDKQVSVVLTL